MKAEELVAHRCPRLAPSPDDAARLASLRPALQAAAYTEDGLQGLFDPSTFVFPEMPAALWRCHRDRSPRAALVRLWLLNDGVERAAVEAVLGSETIATLKSLDALSERSGVLSARVDLYPCEEAWVFTDHSVAAVRPEKHVYELGADSYTLARATPRRKVGRVLDLCTGSGIHAILGAFHARESVGVDINERALDYSRVNAALNDVHETCRFVQGDLYAAVPGEAFDLVVSNPPWIATPEKDMQLYRWGGETGEALTQRIVEGLPTALAPGGTLAMYVIYPVMRGVPYVDRLRAWLGGSDGWGIGVADIIDLPLPVFVRQHLNMGNDWGDYLREFGRWLDSFDRHGIELMRCAMVYVRRLAPGKPGWAETFKLPSPSRSVGASVERWLEAQERCHDPEWPAPDLRPRLAPAVRRFWVDARSGEGTIEHADAWLRPRLLEPAEARFLATLDGTRTVDDIVEGEARASGRDAASTRPEVLERLRLLGAWQVIV